VGCLDVPLEGGIYSTFLTILGQILPDNIVDILSIALGV